ncbi:hypothetical protein Pcinc_021885 [Petrolisthes cinctipes]|uniref:Uncharacterized protein n=1 Tax=Petrolisthes cinctipes TaxID=88211 RepID=A0AAE1FFQ8_PETCI|nr:hypothetical protein Pcinc_021885 [Petrolisthes cinctipes]
MAKKLNRRVPYNQLRPYIHSQLHDARSAAGLEHQDQDQKRQEVHIKREEKVNAAQEKQTADYNQRKKKGSLMSALLQDDDDDAEEITEEELRRALSRVWERISLAATPRMTQVGTWCGYV